MTNDSKKAGWYLDARKAELLIRVVKLIREMLDLGLREAYNLATQARVSPTLLPGDLLNGTFSGKVVSDDFWIAEMAKHGAVLSRAGSNPGSAEAIHEAALLVPSMRVKLEKLSLKALMALARFYNVKGRGKMNRTILLEVLPERLAYSEVVSPTITPDLIREADLLAKRGN